MGHEQPESICLVLLDGDERKPKETAQKSIGTMCPRRKWKSKRKKKYVQVPVKNVMAKEYLEVKAVAKPSFIQFFRETTFF